jgi:hypothetical protein
MFDSLRNIIYAIMWHDIRGSIENILREDGETGEENDLEIEITFDNEDEEGQEESGGEA